MACTREADGSTNRNVFTTDNKCIWLDRLDTMQSNWSHSLQPDTLHSYIEFYPPFARSNSYLRFLTPLPPFVPSLIPLISAHTPLIPLLSASLAWIWPTLIVLFIPSYDRLLSISFPFNSLISSSAFSQFVRLFSTSLLLSYSLDSLVFNLIFSDDFNSNAILIPLFPFTTSIYFELIANLCMGMKIQMFFSFFFFLKVNRKLYILFSITFVCKDNVLLFTKKLDFLDCEIIE